MPAGVIPAIIMGSAVAGSSVVGGVLQSKASKTAAREQTSAVDKQIAWEREQDKLNRADFARTESEKRRQWDAEQAQLAEDRAEERRRYTSETSERQARDMRDFMEDRNRYMAQEARLQPFRREGTVAVGQLGQLGQLAMQAGVQLRPVGQGQMTQGLPGGPGAAPYVPPPAPAVQMVYPTRQGGSMSGLVS